MQIQAPDTLTKTQRRLFLFLLEHEGRIVSHQSLLELLGREDSREGRKLLSAHMSNLRHQISHLPITIDTITKQGYFLRRELNK